MGGGGGGGGGGDEGGGGGGGLAQTKISLTENFWVSKLIGGAGGSRSFGQCPKKNSFFRLIAPLMPIYIDFLLLILIL